MEGLITWMFFIGLGNLILAYGMYSAVEKAQGRMKKVILSIGRVLTILGGALSTAAWYFSPSC